MRPVRRDVSPIATDFTHYEDAKPELISRLGGYCSYCERPIKTNLAVEHIEPKNGPFAQPDLQGRWSNFLLACVNCNSHKGSKQVLLQDILLPDRDNTFLAFVYEADGKIKISDSLTAAQAVWAKNTLGLLGLDKAWSETLDQNGQQVAIDRESQRMEAMATADHALQGFMQQANNNIMEEMIVNLALATGFFSIWMSVFDLYPTMKIRFIQAFKATELSECFNTTTGQAVTPATNPDALPFGGKV